MAGSAALARDRLSAAIALDQHARQTHAQQLTPRAEGPSEIQGTRWRGASRSLRSLASWLAPLGSATSDLPAAEQRTLRARSRDAGRNHMPARAALMRNRTSVVGTGLVCRPAVDHEALGLTAEQAASYNALIRAAWERYAESALESDYESTLDIYGQQGLVLLSAMSSGDVFVLTPMQQRVGGVSELKLQLVEADRVCNPNDAMDTPDCVDGIQLEGGRPVGAWVRNIHPGDRLDMRMPRWDYYPFFGDGTGRRRVLHVWNDKERPGQVRGAPYLAPILEPLKQLERFTNAELMAAVISAMLTVFIQRKGDETDEQGNPVAAFDTADGAGNIALGNGAIVDLAPGEEAKEVNPGRPNAKFDPFFNAILKQIGAALELPLDVLLLQFNSSYSAARAAMLEAWRMFLCRRWLLTTQFCQPIYGLFLDEEVASGRLALPGYADPTRRHAWSRALWIGPARGSMDEQKEASAAKTRIEIGVSNKAMETAAMSGEDWQAVNAQRAREVAIERANGTYVAPSPSPGPGGAPEDAFDDRPTGVPGENDAEDAE
ncbi:phage portal protein [Pseudoxanthomonas winnipegensis]|uniref:Phage portal protein n=1 Tax=Pseudoxanthomonas winnipegensis TaxID=2480810 RepID=A0ABY1WB26_9GAMM|nr:phage portal protein [Pseudoxanthomonas winnipegensis]TAA18207.1 phage portal protein [Pseudoxanthomonas winnipegensis]